MARSSQNRHIGWPQAFRDVFLRIVGRGQLLLFFFGFIILVMVIRMPEGEIGPLAHRLLEIFEVHKLLGYFLWFCTLIAWGFHARLQRRWWHDEMDRMSDERNKVQTHALGDKVKPSGRN